jgi:signal transduction histidine kinase
MNTDRDITEASLAFRKFILGYGILALLLLGALVGGLVWRMDWLAYVSIAVLAVASLFLWGNFGIRLIAWNRFLKEMRIGLERTISGMIASIDEDEAMKEGLEFRALRLMTGEESDKAGGRLLYVDASRFPLPACVGQTVSCRLFGNYVKDIMSSEDH